MKSRIFYFFIGIFLGVLFFFPIDFFQKNLEDFFYAQIGKPFEEIPQIQIKREKKSPLDLDVESAFSLKIFPSGKEKILFEKNSQEILPIASLTKLMTAVIAFENYDLYDEINISKSAASQPDVPNYGNLKEGETFSVRKLLNLALVYSSNDAAFALAEKMGEMGVKEFVEKMNQKAKEIGMENTIFYNPTGLRDGNLNVSTAKDLAKLVKYILKEKPEILKISTEKTIYDPQNSIFEIKLKEGQELVGGKTGFLSSSDTGKDWGCMIFVFKNENNVLFLNIILGAKSSQERIIQMQKLVDWING